MHVELIQLRCFFPNEKCSLNLGHWDCVCIVAVKRLGTLQDVATIMASITVQYSLFSIHLASLEGPGTVCSLSIANGCRQYNVSALTSTINMCK